MVKYAQSELFSVTEFTKQVGSVVKSIKEHTIDKIGILKNNKLEAVLISTDEYERLKSYESVIHDIEDKELAELVKMRIAIQKESISHADMMKKLNVHNQDLA